MKVRINKKSIKDVKPGQGFKYQGSDSLYIMVTLDSNVRSEFSCLGIMPGYYCLEAETGLVSWFGDGETRISEFYEDVTLEIK